MLATTHAPDKLGGSERLAKICGKPDLGVKGMSMLGGAYGAAMHGRELANFNPRLGSVDTQLVSGKKLMDGRSSHMVNNNAHAQSIKNIHKHSIVGPRINLNSKPDKLILGWDDTRVAEFQEEVEARFHNWADSPLNLVDATRRLSFSQLAGLASDMYFTNGEVIATAEWQKSTRDGYKTTIQMIDPNRLDNPSDRSYDFENTRGGIYFNEMGAPQGYYLRNGTPGGTHNQRQLHKWLYVPTYKSWGRQNIVHLFDHGYAGQTRGISKLTVFMREFRGLDQFRLVVLQKLILNAAVAAVLKTPLTQTQAESILSPAGPGQNSSYARANVDILGAIQPYVDGADMNVDGSKVAVLPLGTELEGVQFGSSADLGINYEEMVLRYIAAGAGISYEQLSHDYSKTNYSSARAAMLETWKSMAVIKANIIDKFCDFPWRLWLEEAYNANKLSTLPRGSLPTYYHGEIFDALSKCRWIGPARGQIDEKKETEAVILKYEAGMITLEQACAILGEDYREVILQRSRENEMLAKNNLPLPQVSAMKESDGEYASDEDEGGTKPKPSTKKEDKG